jgi:hypothetical protein
MRQRNTGKRWATLLIVKLYEVAWDLWDHRNQVKTHLETAQDVARREALVLAISSEHAFGRSGLPQRDWCLFDRPLLSTLASLLHYLEAWFLRVQTARLRKDRCDTDAADTLVRAAEDDLPNMNGPRLLLHNFLDSVSHP